MAIFSKIVVATTLLTSFALAAPFRGMRVITETDWTTVDMTTTIFMDEAMSKTFFHTKPTQSFTAVESSSETPSTTPVATPSVAVQTPAFTPAAVNTPPVASTPAVTPQVETSTSITPTAVPASFYTPAVTMAPAMTTTTSATSSTSTASLGKSGSGPSGASDSATCEGETAACQGDITYYAPGLGACGVTNSDTDSIIALPYEFMGTQSNGNPYCGRSLTIYNPANGQTAQATVEDKCMGCVGRAIDLTPSLFEAVGGDLSLGRISGIDWWFN